MVDSAGRKTLRVFTQKYLNHTEYGIGSGKAKELEELVKESNAEQVIVDEHLTSKQIHNLEKLTGVQVIDRERLILDIFYSRATTNEAKLQIQLAEIRYKMPRVREIAKMTAGDERPGKGGRGEYVVDVKFPSKHRAHTEVNMSFDSTTIFAFLACALPILVIVSVSCCIVDPVLVSKLTLKSGTRTSTWRYV